MEGEWRFVSAGLEWLDANKQWVQWVFSGIGVAALGALWALVRWFVARRRGDKAEVQSSRRSVVVGSDMTGSTVVTGNHNVVTVTPTKSVDSEDRLAVAKQLGVNEKTATREQQNRQRMLEKVHNFWINGVLDQSLYHVARIELGLSEEPEAIEHPWKLVAQQPGRTPRPFPDGTPMREVFEQFDKTLLLLGAPGSGKTTLLLELARDLIECAQGDPEHPIPVVFNLSSWALRRPSLDAWLVDELNERYDVPRKVGERWVKNDQVLPLLDGLDEVAREHRDACVEAINAFRTEHGLMPLVVCSRSADYEALTVRLRLPGAITIEPLTREHVEGYLERAGTPLSGVRAAVRDDESLWELLDTPLTLSILALAYQGQIASDVRIARFTGSLEARRAALFDAYIEAMFKRRSASSRYTPEQTRHWLSWLAQAMVQYEQTVFYLEHMQPGWLLKAHTRLQRIGSGLFFGLVGGLPLGLVGGLFFGLDSGLVLGLFFGLLFGLSFGLVLGLVGELFFGLRQQIQLVEVLYWSWKKARARLFFGLFFGLVLGLVFGLLTMLFFVLFFVLLSVLFVGLVSGLVADEIPERTIPNEGIRRSLRNALRVGLVSGLLAGLLAGLVFGLVGGLPLGLVFGLFVGLVSGLFFGLEKGGVTCIQHGVLRLLLWRNDYAPLRYVRFLEHAKELLFLRRVGGGYIFVHRLLMAHFAGLEKQEDTVSVKEVV